MPPPVYDGEFIVVIYNKKIMFVINCKDAHPIDFPSLPGILWNIVLSLGHVDWQLRHVGQFLLFSLCYHVYGLGKWTNTPVALSSLHPC